ncbi:MAG TPA: phage major capsid protein [Longimicrobiales bacterium]|nr:phage major capsid protein [Longimicrobiales bacterium]
MPALPTFADFVAATRERKITSPEDILNDAVNQRTWMIGEMLKGQDPSLVVQGGQKISDRIKLDNSNTFQFYSPNERFNPTSVDTLTTIEANWRFAKAHYSFSEEEIELNQTGSLEQFVNLRTKYEQDAYTDIYNGMEDALWAVPSSSAMEASGGLRPYSIPAFVTEDTTDYHPSGFTTIMGVDPASSTRWRNQVETYLPSALDDQDNGIIAAFDSMFLSVKFESPDTASQYFENDRLRRMKILTNKDGFNIYQRLLRAGNDRYAVSPQDPAYMNPVFNGIPVKYISALDTAALYSGSAAATGQPRYYWLNFNYMFPVFHARRYMRMKGPIEGGVEQPFSAAVYFNLYYNLFMRSRRRQGIVAPAA